MKPTLLLIAMLSILYNATFARQNAPAGPPVEDGYINWGWWLLGVIIAIAVGMLAYIFLKKNPRKDAR